MGVGSLVFCSVASFDSGYDVTFYYDGTQLGTLVTGTRGALSSSGNLNLGDSTDAYTGNMDEVAIYNHALSSSDVGKIYHSGNPDQQVSEVSGLLGWWRMGDGGASYDGVNSWWSIPDASGNNYNMVLSGPTGIRRADTAGTSPGLIGDPVFYGFQGQHFEVHGLPNEFFNLWSTPTHHINARFIYLDADMYGMNATRELITWTPTWNHAGTYISQVGVLVCGHRVLITADRYDIGLHVSIDDKIIPVSYHSHDIHVDGHKSCQLHVDHTSRDSVVLLQHGMFKWTLINSHMFINIAASLLHSELKHAGKHYVKIREGREDENQYPNYPLHGLIGNTWRNAVYDSGHLWQGTSSDYEAQPDDTTTDHDSLIWSTNSYFSQYAWKEEHTQSS